MSRKSYSYNIAPLGKKSEVDEYTIEGDHPLTVEQLAKLHTCAEQAYGNIAVIGDKLGKNLTPTERGIYAAMNAMVDITKYKSAAVGRKLSTGDPEYWEEVHKVTALAATTIHTPRNKGQFNADIKKMEKEHLLADRLRKKLLAKKSAAAGGGK
jgi:hypothetical protein